jgi:glutathione S-transferase
MNLKGVSEMIKIYDHPLSGNCYKVRLLMTQSNVGFESETIDVFKGENKKDKYIKINPTSKIPAIDDDGLIIWESNAILLYLCEKYSPFFLPFDLIGRSNAYKWLFFNKTSLDPFLAKARAILKFYPEGSQDLDELAVLQNEGLKSLKIVEEHLEGKIFFVENYSIVDIAFYPYIKLSHEGKIELSQFPNILRWIKSVENTKNFISFS